MKIGHRVRRITKMQKHCLDIIANTPVYILQLRKIKMIQHLAHIKLQTFQLIVFELKTHKENTHLFLCCPDERIDF